MKKLLACLLSAAMLLTSAGVGAFAAEADEWDGTTSQTWYGDGSADTFTISTAEDLAGLAELVNSNTNFEGKTINLATDIDLAGKEWTPIGLTTRASIVALGKNFKGTFLGGNHTISGLKITQGNANQTIGLFGNVNNGTIQDLTVANVDINAPACENAGGIVGMMTGSSTVKNCHVSGKIIAHDAGGITARMIKEGTITGCTNAAVITGTESAAGIVAKAYYTEIDKDMLIENCTNTGAITCTAYHAGGISAFSAADVQSCTNSAVITAKKEGTFPAPTAGGIVAEQTNCGTVSGCENTAAINGIAVAGGIVGWIRYNTNASAYKKNEIITVTGNTNSGVISNTEQFGSAGIVGETYNAAVITNNINTAPAINGYTFAAGITTLTHSDGNLFYGEEESYQILNNVSTTPEDQLTLGNGGTCKALFAYNNLGSENPAVVIEGNTTTQALASIGDQTFGTLEELVVAAIKMGATPFTVKLLSSFELPEGKHLDIAENQTVTIDFNGYILSKADNAASAPIENNGVLTLTDTSAGKKGGISGNNRCVNNYNNLTIDAGYYTTSSVLGGTAIRNANSTSVMVINDCTVIAGSYAVYNYGTATINGGLFQNSSCGTCHGNWSYTISSEEKLYINNAEVHGVQGALSVNGGYAEIHDGTFYTHACELDTHPANKTSATFYALYVAGGVKDSTCIVDGGNFTSESPYAVVCIGNDTVGDGGIAANAYATISNGTFTAVNSNTPALKKATQTGHPQVSGGTFSSALDPEVCAPGFEPVETEGGYGVVPVTVAISKAGTDALAPAEGTGTLRFITKVDALEGTVESFGTWILPMAVFESNESDWAKAPFAKVEYTGEDIKADETFAADLTGIPQERFEAEIIAQSYIIVDGKTETCLFDKTTVSTAAAN